MSLELSPSLSQMTLIAGDDSEKIDPDFYFDSTFAVFEAEGHLFRVPIYLFAKESSYFISEFTLSKPDSPDGISETILLPPDIRWKDFRNLLKALYPISVATDLFLSQEEWISVLKLSTKWHFDNLTDMAIPHLESLQSFTSLSPVDRIVLGRQCYISSWTSAALREILDRKQSISDDEAVILGLETTVKLFRLREHMPKKNQKKEAIDREFANELALDRLFRKH